MDQQSEESVREGTLSRDELAGLLKMINVNADENEFEAILGDIDEDGACRLMAGGVPDSRDAQYCGLRLSVR